MLKVTLWHEPQYFQFYIQDPKADTARLSTPAAHQQMDDIGFFESEGLVAVRVQSEFNQIPVVVEYDSDEPAPKNLEDWDRVVECSLRNRSAVISFQRCPSGVFGELQVPAGTYRLRIYYGGQNDADTEEDATDHYWVQVWPAAVQASRILKD